MAQSAVPVVAEHLHDALPHLGYLVHRYPRAQPLGEPRVGGQSAAHPQVEAGTVIGVDHADERDVVRLVRGVGQPSDRRLELPRQVGQRRIADVPVDDLADRLGGVQDLVLGHAGHRAADDHARGVAARLRGGEPDALEALPDRRDVLDAYPVQLYVLPVCDIRHISTELGGDVRHGP